MEQHQVHVWENTYQMEPKEDQKFLPSKVTELRRGELPHFVFHRRNFIPLFYSDTLSNPAMKFLLYGDIWPIFSRLPRPS